MSKTHGDSKGGKYYRLYKIWADMKQRCLNPRHSRYKDYGGRGIGVCNDWLDYIPFKNWAVRSGYSDNLTIDRINPCGNYSPSNCRWANYYIQNNNKRCSNRYEHSGEAHTIAEWSRITGICYHTLSNRIHQYGWDIHRALSTPVAHRHLIAS